MEVFLGFAVLFILTLQGVVKPWRFFGFAAVFILNLQGVVKPWRVKVSFFLKVNFCEVSY
ncbi:MAG: hypothetical protein GDA51_05470 [Ekhidna sp.]|nr:hypothetical protein [Ekhidna sp.]